jgi:acid phosphatase (class A)
MLKTRMLVVTWMMGVAPLVLAQDNVMRPGGASNRTVTHFFSLDTFNVKALIPQPPAPGSFTAQVDLETVLQAQAWRTPEQVAWAKLVETDNVFNHASLFGDWFKADRLPMTAVLFKAIADDMRALDPVAKIPFQRPRPSSIDSWVKPCVSVPGSSSYPSGAATQAFVWAELLSDALPAKRDELRSRAHRAAWGRVIGGVHFPSDIVAGRLLAQAYVAECRKSAAFRDAFAACKQELVAAATAGKTR